MVTIFLRRYIAGVSTGQLFSTRECLQFGSRTAVDQALCRMVKKGIIVRVARGLFAKASPVISFSAFQIARAKAEAFGKAIAKPSAMTQRDNVSALRQNNVLFLTNGSSSAFQSQTGRISLKGICPRKFRLTETKAGRYCLAIWQLGRQSAPAAPAYDLATGITRQEIFIRLKFWLPAWLADKFKTRAYPSSGIRLSDNLNPPCWLSTRLPKNTWADYG